MTLSFVSMTQSLPSSLRRTPHIRVMERIVYAPKDFWLVGVLVRPEQEVVPGKILFEVMGQQEGGCTEHITSKDYGVIKPILGGTMFHETNGAQLDVYVKKGTPMYRISIRPYGNDAGTIRGLTPRPTNVIARRARRQLANG